MPEHPIENACRKFWLRPRAVSRIENAHWLGPQKIKHKVAAQTRRYRAAKKNRMPVWADLEAIDEIYLLAQNVSSTTEALSVDHIVPLNGALVSGLHVANNLQLLNRADNTRKGNKFNPELSGFSFRELQVLFAEFDNQVAVNGR